MFKFLDWMQLGDVQLEVVTLKHVEGFRLDATWTWTQRCPSWLMNLEDFQVDLFVLIKCSSYWSVEANLEDVQVDCSSW